MSKERMADLVKLLREASSQMDPAARAAVELVKLAGEAAKESLVTADGNDMLRHQGAAQAYAKLHKDMTTNPPQLRRSEN